jgi:chemotaxis protein methyltransferase WspC
MTQAAIVTLLRHTIGLNPDAIGAEIIARTIRQCLAQGGMSDMQTDLERSQTSEQELHALIEEVLVPEPWFFRDQMPFVYLEQYVMAEWLPSHPHAVFRVLSMACSTGEEPYSTAMALLDTGLASQHVCIDAVDIRHQALHQARQAVYGHHSFRGHDLRFRERYCKQS